MLSRTNSTIQRMYSFASRANHYQRSDLRQFTEVTQTTNASSYPSMRQLAATLNLIIAHMIQVSAR